MLMRDVARDCNRSLTRSGLSDSYVVSVRGGYYVIKRCGRTYDTTSEATHITKIVEGIIERDGPK